MKTIPMIFNQQMVTALVDGRKTVTRRPLSNQPIKNGSFWDFKWGAGSSLDYLPIVAGHATANAAPFKIGDLIWVRETFRQFNSYECGCSESPCGCPNNGTYIYKATGDDGESKWKPSIHMPRKASRLTLRVTDVRCERVQAITEEQAKREGVYPARPSSLVAPYYISFMDLWESLYENWCENPWVWVIEFELIKSNIDKVIANECN